MNLDLNFLLLILIWFGGNGTIATLVAIIVDLLKRIPGLVKDGSSATWAAAINLLGMVGFATFFFLSPATSFEGMDETLRTLLAIVQIVLGYALQLFVSPAVHNNGADSNLPILGYSMTFNKQV